MWFPDRRVLLVLGLALTTTAAVGAAWSQARPEEGSLATVAAELRQLRATVEESIRTQSQTQALGVLLATHQSRVAQLTMRLDAVRAELTAATEKARSLATMVASRQAELGRVTDATQRNELDRMLRGDKEEADKAAGAEFALRAHESQLLQELQAAEARWTEFVERLEQAIKR